MKLSPTDALALLTRHHRQLDELFAEIFDAEDAEQRGWAVQKAADHLAGLMESEEKVLLPRLREDDPYVREALMQHAALRAQMSTLLELAPVDEAVEPRARELYEALLDHHRFERDGFFPHVADQLEPALRERLGTALADCMVRLYAAGAPRRALHLRTAREAQASSAS